MENKDSNKCEYCGNTLTIKYGSGRFCSQKCARGFSTRNNRKEINKRISKSLTGKPTLFSTNPDKQRAIAQKGAEANRLNKLKRKVKVKTTNRTTIVIDITYAQLEEYRNKHHKCEICGKEEVSDTVKRGKANNLSIDHSHNLNKFRGLLCCSCNRKLGWFEKEHNNIEQYLDKNDPEWRNR